MCSLCRLSADPRYTLTRQISCEVCSLSRLLVAKNHNFGQTLTFGGSRTDPLSPMMVKFGVLEQTRGLHLHAKFHLNVFTVSAFGGQKPQFLANCDFWGAPVPTVFYRSGPNLVWSSAFYGVDSWLQSENTGAQLQTFPYPTVSKSLV